MSSLIELHVRLSNPLQRTAMSKIVDTGSSGPSSLAFDSFTSNTPLPSLTGVSFAYSTLENALPAIIDEVLTCVIWIYD